MSNSMQRPARRRGKRDWSLFLIGLVAVLAVVLGIVLGNRSRGNMAATASPYAEKLKVSDIKLSAAENYVGGTVTYLDVNVTNTGEQTLYGALMHAIFKNSMGQVVQTEMLPLHVLVQNKMGGYPDQVELSRAPIAPGQTRTLRMTLDHISDDWDRNAPDMQLVGLKLK